MTVVDRQKAAQALRVSEKDWQVWVIDVAKTYGWLVHHVRPARKADGSWSTPLQGDKGFPDLVLCHPKRGQFILVELKSDSGHLTPDQESWFYALAIAGCQAAVWRPADREYVLAFLSPGQAVATA